MCSIFGIVDFENKIKSKDLISKKINNLLNHRGPDSEGYFNDKFVSFAFNRLSIMDLKKGNQPIIRENIISIFNGEIYNFKEIKKKLIAKGYTFKTNSDTEVLIHGYKEWKSNLFIMEIIYVFNTMIQDYFYRL